MMTTLDTTPRIYVASLSDYNAGRLHGVWINAANGAEEINEKVVEMLEHDGNVIHVRLFEGRWLATQTTADCSRFVRHCGRWDSLAEAVPTLREWHEAGVLRLSATAAQVAEAKAVEAR